MSAIDFRFHSPKKFSTTIRSDPVRAKHFCGFPGVQESKVRKLGLGFETQRQWSDQAIHRTTPLLLGLFSLVTLWTADQAARTGKLAVLGAAWYRKPDPTFADCLAVVRRVLWAEEAVSPLLWRDDYPTWRARARTAENPRPLQQRLAELMSYAA